MSQNMHENDPIQSSKHLNNLRQKFFSDDLTMSPGRPRGKTSPKDFITEQEYLLLQENELIPYKYRLMYRVLYHSAFRIDELLSLKPEDLKIEENQNNHELEYYAVLKKQKSGPEGEFVPLLPKDYKLLQDYIKKQKKRPDEYIFTGQRGRHTGSWINEQFKRHCKMTGIRVLTTHAFRRAFITRQKQRGWSYEDIADVTRHKRIDTMRKHYDKGIKSRAFRMLTGQRLPKIIDDF